MSSILFWTVALVVVTLLRPVLRLVIAMVAGKQIGAGALAKQPDTIQLERRDPSAWKDLSQVRPIVQALRSRGFVDVGVHAVRELPGLLVQLLVHAGDGFSAAIYEHPRAGIWFDLLTRFQDGTSITFTTGRPTPLAPRPGHPSVNVQGMEPTAVVEQALAERPQGWRVAVSAEQAVAMFQLGYAESTAYRKQTGISRREVMKIAARKVA